MFQQRLKYQRLNNRSTIEQCAISLINCIFNRECSTEEKFLFFERTFDRLIANEIEVVKDELEAKYVFHKALIDDAVAPSIIQWLINLDLTVDLEDENRDTPLTKALLYSDFNKLSVLTKRKLVLYFFNCMLIYAMNPVKEKALGDTLTPPIRQLQWGFEGEMDKFNNLYVLAKNTRFEEWFTDRLLQVELNKTNDHNIFSGKHINEIVTFLQNEKISPSSIDKWYRTIQNVRGVYCLKQFMVC